MKYAVLFFSIFMFFACGKKDKKNTSTKKIDSSLPENFKTFYTRFHEDSIFQMKHILFPLEGVPANIANREIDVENFRWQKENWVLHKSLELGENFQKTLEPSLNNRIILESIQDTVSKFGILRRFAKRGDDYFLIYYSDMNQISK